MNSFANNLGDTFPSCIGIIKLIEVKSVERLLVLCTPFLATLRSLSLVYCHISCKMWQKLLQKVTSACPVSSSPHEKKEGVEQENHCRVAEKEKWQGKHKGGIRDT